MKIVVHFGMPKTGSSSIQASLAKNLQDPRFRYIKLSGQNQNEAMVSLFKAQPDKVHVHRRRGHSIQDISRLRDKYSVRFGDELTASAGKTAIISSEVISNFNARELGRLYDYLKRWSDDITAVGYVRAPKGLMESGFQQRVKGPACDFDMQRLFPNYMDRFGKFESVFGEGHVWFWKFDPLAFPFGDVVLDFCNRLGVTFSTDFSVRVNEGLSMAAVGLLYTYRKLGPGYGWGGAAVNENKGLVDTLAEIVGPRLRLHSSLVEPVIREHGAQVAWMEDRLGASLVEDLWADDGVAVRSEKELFTYAPETLAWLAEHLGSEYVARSHANMAPQEVADWVHLLRLKVAGSDGWRKGTVGLQVPPEQEKVMRQESGPMGLEHLVQDAKRSNPALGSLADEVGVGLLREVFQQIGCCVDRVDQGSVTIMGLGKFNVRTVRRDDNGTVTRVKRTLFEVERLRSEDDAAGVAHAGDIPRIQESNATRYNRYKNVFAAVKEVYLPSQPTRILSFGCSNGDEPLSLAEVWFPEARILGLDVNDECLSVATEKTRPVSDRVEIAHSSQAILDAWGPFDIVFAMSVLCAWPISKQLSDISSVYSFKDFEKHVTMLGNVLKQDGLLVIWNASFRFSDSKAAARFDPVPVDGIGESGFVKKFGPDNKELAVQDYPLFIFRRIA